MHAILLISATHLSYLLPNESTYHRASALHLSQTLHLFRHALSQPVTQHNADALMATSLLLVHHAWATVDNIQTSTASDHSADQNQPSVGSSYQAQLDLSLRTRSSLILEGHAEFLWPLLTLSRPTRASSLPLLSTGLAIPSCARLHTPGLAGRASLRNFSPGAIRVYDFHALHSSLTRRTTP